MENCEVVNTKMKLLTKQTLNFWAGTLLCVIAAILFFVGMYGAARRPLWIATAIVGGVGVIFFAFSMHSVNGWTRMFSVFFMEMLIVIGTVMAVTCVLTA